MAIRILIILLPYLVGWIWHGSPEASIAWSLGGSVFVAAIAQTNWFQQTSDNVSFKHRLLRPVSLYSLIFVAYNVLGGGAYALDTAGYTIWGGDPIAPTGNLLLIAECQRMMLLGQSSVTSGMKIVGLNYGMPRYEIPNLPPYSLIVISFITFGAGTLFSFSSTFNQLSQKFFVISTISVSVEIAVAIRNKRFNNLLLTLILFGLNLFQDSVSGWKGNILWGTIILGALLFPMMPKQVVVAGTAFVFFWALFFYPFGLALRPLIWSEGFDRNTAVEISMRHALEMPLDERLDIVWTMMVGRANDQYQFGKYVEFVPDKHPYYSFDILSDSLTALVPRVLWADKPDMEIVSMQRVYDAGIVSAESIVSAKSNFYQDSYLSGGEPVILFAGLLFGIVIAAANRLCERMFGGYGIGTCLIYTSLFATILTQPPNFEYLFGALAMSVVLTLFLFTLGRGTGWIVPARSDQKKQGRVGDLIGKTRIALNSPERI